MRGRPETGGFKYSPQFGADPSGAWIQSRPNGSVWARYGVSARRTRMVAVVAAALLACSPGLAAARQKHAAPRSVTTSVSQTVKTPGTYLVVVSVRTLKQPEMVSVYVAGQSPRTIQRWQAHLWLGFSAERQIEFDARWEDMKAVAKAGFITFVSIAPMLAPVTLPPDFLRPHTAR